MQTTLRIDERIYREAKAEAARTKLTLTRFIEEALAQKLQQSKTNAQQTQVSREMAERNRLMEALLRRTAHFRVGTKPTRKEMNER